MKKATVCMLFIYLMSKLNVFIVLVWPEQEDAAAALI